MFEIAITTRSSVVRRASDLRRLLRLRTRGHPPMPSDVRRACLWLALLSTIYSQAAAFSMLGGPRSRGVAPNPQLRRTPTVHLEAKKPVQKPNRFDLLIIGAGPVGVTAALRAAARGHRCRGSRPTTWARLVPK